MGKLIIENIYLSELIDILRGAVNFQVVFSLFKVIKSGRENFILRNIHEMIMTKNRFKFLY